MGLVTTLAAWAFFDRLGNAPLNDWDEAWHAEVSREILTTHDWLTLHYRGEVYFNKPPLTFWIRASAFKIWGMTDTAARLGSACFGWASIVLLAWFVMRRLGTIAGTICGLILSTSWLFVTYHAGRSGETDGALVFFSVATLLCLWRAVWLPGWFYAAGICTALGWMTKGATAYLPWMAVIGVILIDRSQPRWKWKHAAAGLALGFVLAAPWQIIMLCRHGSTFFRAFYIHEAIEPTLGVSEGHAGHWTFHLSSLRLFFQPWLSLAGAGALAVIFLRERRPFARWALAWGIVTLGGCSLIPTKLIWYAAPAMPPLATLAGMAVATLLRRSIGWIVLIPAALLAVAHFRQPSWLAPSLTWDIALALTAAAVIYAPITRNSLLIAAGLIAVAVPITLDGSRLHEVIRSGANPEEWFDRREPDEPWRELSAQLAKDFSDQPIVLLGFPRSPAAEFYLRRALGDHSIIEPERSESKWNLTPNSILIIRTETAVTFEAIGYKPILHDEGLTAMERFDLPN